MKAKILLSVIVFFTVVNGSVFCMKDTQDMSIQTLKEHPSKVRSVAFGPDGKTLASGDLDKKIRIWEKKDNKWVFVQKLTGHTWQVCSVVFSSDGKTLASCSMDKTIRIWKKKIISGNLFRS